MNPTIHGTLQGEKPVTVTAFVPGVGWHDPTFRVPGSMPASGFPETGLLALADGRIVRLALEQQYQVRPLENGQVVYEAASPSDRVEVSYQFPGYPNLKTSCCILEPATADIIPSPSTQPQFDHNEYVQEGAQAAKESKRLSAIALANPGQLGILKKPGEWEAAVIGRYHDRNWTILVLSNGCAFSYRPNLLPLDGPDVPYRAKERIERIRVVAPEKETGKVRYDNGMKDVEFTETDYSYANGVIYPATVEDWENARQNAGRNTTATQDKGGAKHATKKARNSKGRIPATPAERAADREIARQWNEYKKREASENGNRRPALAAFALLTIGKTEKQVREALDRHATRQKRRRAVTA